MSPTLKLYDLDAYQSEFEAVVLSCEKADDKKHEGNYIIHLDRTCFFPEEGGQTPDYGTIDNVMLTDVQIRKSDEGEIIDHFVEKPIEIGSKVTGRVDFEHRFDNMQQHSAEHIFSGIVHNDFGLDNVGFHLSDHIVTMDFNGVLTDEQVRKIEEKVNKVITSNVEIKVFFPDKEELEKLEYRSKKEIDGAVRIVTIEGVDVCACCAPHVHRTGEIGLLKVINRQNYKKGVRITIEAGKRALNSFLYEHDMLKALADKMTTSISEIPAKFDQLSKENMELGAELKNFKMNQIRQKIDALPVDTEYIYFFEKDLDMKSAQYMINLFQEKSSGYCVVLIGKDKDYKIIIGSSQKDCLAAFKKLGEYLDIKGGGSLKMAQGKVTDASREKITDALEQVFNAK